MSPFLRIVFVCIFLLLAAGCDDSAPTLAVNSADEAAAEALNSVSSDSSNQVSDPVVSHQDRVEQSLNELEKGLGFSVFKEPWTGDLDTMIEERVIRVLTVYGVGRYSLEKGSETGLTYELFQMFDTFINDQEKKGHLRVHVVFLPVARDQLIPALLSGRGDIVAAGLTITPERQEQVDFSNPASKPLSEILVTGPDAPTIESLNDLSGKEIYVRASSSYRASIDLLNENLREQGLAEVVLVDADELLEDEDLLEMVSSGLLPWAVVDDYKAEIWAGVFENLTVRNDLVLRKGGRLGFAIRKDSPQLKAALNEFLKTHKQGTLSGNILINRYLKNYDWTQNALASDDLSRFTQLKEIFARYGDQYGIDYLMVAAQGYQESRLDQGARSGAGALGVMQLLPTTAADSNVGIPDISTAENNIHAGVKYLDFIRNRYFDDPEMDRFNQTMFAFAAYNAGPARVRGLREKARQQGYDPNVWFDNVEVIAAREIGRETVQYVSNILKYYVAYNLTLQQQIKHEEAVENAK